MHSQHRLAVGGADAHKHNEICGASIRKCAIELPVVPAGKRLVIGHFSGFVAMEAVTGYWVDFPKHQSGRRRPAPGLRQWARGGRG